MNVCVWMWELRAVVPYCIPKSILCRFFVHNIHSCMCVCFGRVPARTSIISIYIYTTWNNNIVWIWTHISIWFFIIIFSSSYSVLFCKLCSHFITIMYIYIYYCAHACTYHYSGLRVVVANVWVCSRLASALSLLTVLPECRPKRLPYAADTHAFLLFFWIFFSISIFRLYMTIYSASGCMFERAASRSPMHTLQNIYLYRVAEFFPHRSLMLQEQIFFSNKFVAFFLLLLCF